MPAFDDPHREIHADLHTHTQCSDGTASPRDLVRRAAERGLAVLAVTDHDTVAGLDAAADEAQAQGLQFVSGIELSVTTEDGEIHLLAYGIDPSHEALQNHLAAMQEARRDRAWEIIDRLQGEGVDVMDDVLRSDIASTEAVGRPHVAAALVRAGTVETTRQAFEQYLGAGGIGDVPKPAFASGEALAMVHEAGGIGVLAHPGHWTSSALIRQLTDEGLDGIETIHPSHDDSLRRYYARLADGYGLVQTGGSDYHGRGDSAHEDLGTTGMTRTEWERLRTAIA